MMKTMFIWTFNSGNKATVWGSVVIMLTTCRRQLNSNSSQQSAELLQQLEQGMHAGTHAVLNEVYCGCYVAAQESFGR